MDPFLASRLRRRPDSWAVALLFFSALPLRLYFNLVLHPPRDFIFSAALATFLLALTATVPLEVERGKCPKRLGYRATFW
jgi:hypothetical protein